jgi:hypothetical protein
MLDGGGKLGILDRGLTVEVAFEAIGTTTSLTKGLPSRDT